MIPILTKLFDKLGFTLSISSISKDSPATKLVNKNKGHHNNITNDLVIKNEYNQTFTVEAVEPRAPKVTKPSPSEILADISKSHLLDVDKSRENYVDQEICWKIKILSMSQEDELFRISGVSLDSAIPILVLQVLASQNPRLKSARRDIEVFVKAKIDKVDQITIYLKDATVVYSE